MEATMPKETDLEGKQDMGGKPVRPACHNRKTAMRPNMASQSSANIIR
jgi:hypothetical protein